MILFVQLLFENLFVNSIALYLFIIQIFDQNLIFFTEHRVYKHCGDVGSDIVMQGSHWPENLENPWKTPGIFMLNLEFLAWYM